jgi:spore maturation protein CgeB
MPRQWSDELFEIGRELITHGDDADLLDKIGYYLAHEEERVRIAAAGQRRAGAAHLPAPGAGHPGGGSRPSF